MYIISKNKFLNFFGGVVGNIKLFQELHAIVKKKLGYAPWILKKQGLVCISLTYPLSLL
jgi:hypothetical protein